MKIIRGTIFGGILLFFLGWIVYGILLAGYMKDAMNGCTNRPMEEMVWWAMILSCFAWALLLTLVLNWSGASGIVSGLKTGAVVGFLFALNIDLNFYSMTTMFNSFSAVVVDMVVYAVNSAIAGLVIVLTWGKGKAT